MLHSPYPIEWKLYPIQVKYKLDKINDNTLNIMNLLECFDKIHVKLDHAGLSYPWIQYILHVVFKHTLKDQFK